MSRKHIIARRSAIHGNGVFAAETIAKGERIVRYRGTLRTHADVDAVYGELPDDGHTFLFTLNDKYVVDANTDGNIARWINHSCDPNCEAVIEEHGGKKRKDKIWIEAIRDIALDEELSYDYGIVLEVPHTAAMKKLWACHCGARHCTGTLLQPKRGRRGGTQRHAAATSAPKTV